MPPAVVDETAGIIYSSSSDAPSKRNAAISLYLANPLGESS
jgi:hypothetical protein